MHTDRLKCNCLINFQSSESTYRFHKFANIQIKQNLFFLDRPVRQLNLLQKISTIRN